MSSTMQRQTGNERSLGELLSAMTSDVSLLVRKELELAKAETKDELRTAGRAAGAMGAAAFVGYLAVLMLSFAAAWGLSEVMAAGWAFLIVGVVYAVIGAVLFVQARARAREISPVPQQTVETLKEDVEWARARKS
jgi:putative superfamily III holin-X